MARRDAPPAPPPGASVPAEQSAHSSRVSGGPSTSAARMPWPGSPMSWAIGAAELDLRGGVRLVAALSLRRWIMMPVARCRPAASPARRSRRRPRSVRASVRKTSECGTEKNHLCPAMRQAVAVRARRRVCVWRRSEPPCFSVIAMPTVTPVLSAARDLARIVAGRTGPVRPHSAQRSRDRALSVGIEA